VAATFRSGLPVAAVVLCDTEPATADDPSLPTNRSELAQRIAGPMFTTLGFGQMNFQPAIDWLDRSKLARDR